MAFTLTDYKNKYLKPGIIILVAVIVIIIVFLVFALKPKPKSPAPPQTNLPETVGNLEGEPVIPFISEREKPTENVETIKKEILNRKIGEDKGTIILFRTEAYIIEYIPTPDLFLVTILSTPVEQNKTVAENWFKDFGLTENEICALPVRFSLGITDPNYNEKFNPFPSGCQ